MMWFDLVDGGVVELDGEPALELQLRFWDGEAWWLWVASESGAIV